jgi:hypothetical protein
MSDGLPISSPPPSSHGVSEEQRTILVLTRFVEYVLLTFFFENFGFCAEITDKLMDARKDLDSMAVKVDLSTCEPSSLYPGVFRARPVDNEELRLLKLKEYDVHAIEPSVQGFLFCSDGIRFILLSSTCCFHFQKCWMEWLTCLPQSAKHQSP